MEKLVAPYIHDHYLAPKASKGSLEFRLVVPPGKPELKMMTVGHHIGITS